MAATNYRHRDSRRQRQQDAAETRKLLAYHRGRDRATGGKLTTPRPPRRGDQQSIPHEERPDDLTAWAATTPISAANTIPGRTGTPCAATSDRDGGKQESESRWQIANTVTTSEAARKTNQDSLCLAIR